MSHFCYATSTYCKMTLWHKKMGHLGITNLQKMKTQDMAIGLEFDVNKEKEFCGTCAENKSTRKPFKGKGTVKRWSR